MVGMVKKKNEVSSSSSFSLVLAKCSKDMMHDGLVVILGSKF